MASKKVCVFLLLNLVINAFSVPMPLRNKKEISDDEMQNEIQENTQFGMDDSVAENSAPAKESTGPADSIEFDDDDDDDDDFDFEPSTSSTSSGSNIFSLFNLLQGFFTSSSGNERTRNIIRNHLEKYVNRNKNNSRLKRSINKNDDKLNSINNDFDSTKEIINIDDITNKEISLTKNNRTLKNNNKRNKTKTKLNIKESESIEDFSDEYNDDDEESDENSSENGANSSKNDEKSSENGNETANDGDENGNGDASSDEDDYDDDFGGGDGQGGGVLGVLAGLSGENGESDLGALLATVSGILASLSGGDDFDLNSIIAAGVGLLVGLLSEGEQNPGTVIANYFLTSIDSITGGGSTNNGAFFGSLVSRLLRGISASDRDTTSESSWKTPFRNLRNDILKAILQFGTGLVGAASSTSANRS